MGWLRTLLRRWLGIADLEVRVGVVEVVAEHGVDRAAIAGGYAIAALQAPAPTSAGSSCEGPAC